jgi:hypothetical protein
MDTSGVDVSVDEESLIWCLIGRADRVGDEAQRFLDDGCMWHPDGEGMVLDAKLVAQLLGISFLAFCRLCHEDGIAPRPLSAQMRRGLQTRPELAQRLDLHYLDIPGYVAVLRT